MEKDQNRQLRNSLPFIIRAMTGQMGLKYVPVGPPRITNDTLYTDPLPLFLDEKATTIILGDLYHEIGHGRYTDFDLIKSEKLLPMHSRLRFSVWNSVEDTMSERLMGADFYGCRMPVALSVEYAIERGHGRTGEQGPADALITFVDLWGRKFVNRQNVEPNFSIARGELLKHLGEKGLDKLTALVGKRLPLILTTAQSFKLADDILELIKDISDIQNQPLQAPGNKPQQPQTQDQLGSSGSGSATGTDGSDAGSAKETDSGKDSGQGASGNAGDDEAGQDDSDPGAPSSSANGADDSDPDAGVNDSGKGTNCGDDDHSGLNGNATPDDGAQTNPSGSASNGDASQGNGEGYGKGAGGILDDLNVPDGPVINLKEMALEVLADSGDAYRFDPDYVQVKQCDRSNLECYEEWKKGIQGETMMLQRKLAVAFMTLKKSKTITTDEGRLNGRRLHLALAKRTDVYSAVVKSALPSPAVIFLCDVSGSMKGLEHALSMQAAIAMCEVMHLLGVPFEMWTYQGNRVTNYKLFEEPFSRKVKERMGASYASGGTPTANGLWVTASRLVARKEARKILILTTDGAPDRPDHAKEVGEIIENSGIELYGIGIGVPPAVMADFCSHYAVMQGPDEIAHALLAVLSQRMLSR